MNCTRLLLKGGITKAIVLETRLTSKVQSISQLRVQIKNCSEMQQPSSRHKASCTSDPFYLNQETHYFEKEGFNTFKLNKLI